MATINYDVNGRAVSGRYEINDQKPRISGVEREETKKKIFLSHPMRGCTMTDIRIARKEMELAFRNRFPDMGIEIMDTVNHPEPSEETDSRLYYLGCSIQKLGLADFIVFSKDYKDAAGCRVEETVAINYGITRIYL